MFPPGTEDHRVVQLTDIFPTVLALAGIDNTAYPCHGYDLLGDTIPEDRPVFCEYYYPRQVMSFFPEGQKDAPAMAKYLRSLRSIKSGDMKLIWGSDRKHELYDLSQDPGEQTNLFGNEAYAEVVHELTTKLDEIVGRYSTESNGTSLFPQDVIDERTEDALRAIGYIH
jgi:arylsulfatase A-like enzyme